MNELDAQVTDFTSDWLLREPALALCHRFAAKPAHWLASVVLIEELLQAMFALSNQELAQAKLTWWADEADLTISGAPRHPLTKSLIAARAEVQALPNLTRAARGWILLPTAADAHDARKQFAELAAAASDLVGEGDCTAIWTELALKRQMQSYIKPDRYGPSVLSRAALAEFQLKISQISDTKAVAAALSEKLTSICQTLREALPGQARGMQSATRAYALVHAREAAAWAKSAGKAQAGFLSRPPGVVGLLQAWWSARI